MTVEELRAELETLISSLTSSGFENLDSGVMEKMEKYLATAGDLGMNEGKRLIENLLGAIKSINEGKSKAESANVRLTALDFYLKNLSGSEHIEDL